MSLDKTHERAGRRSWVGWPHVGILAVVSIQLAGFASLAVYRSRPTPGAYVLFYTEPTLTAWPATEEAELLMRGWPRPLQVVAVNGRQMASLSYVTEVWSLFDRREGATNSFVLRDAHGALHGVQLHAAASDPAVLLRWRYLDLLYWLVGILYLALGVFVWRKRPADRTARALLALTLVAGFNSAVSVQGTALGFAVVFLRVGTFALWGPAALYFGLVFTGSNRSGWGRWLVRGTLVVALVLGGFRLLTVYLLLRQSPLGGRWGI